MQKRAFYLILFLAIVICGLLYFSLLKENNDYIPITPIAVHHNGMKFISHETCVECHPKIVENHLKTAHFNSFQPANTNTIKGSFKKGQHNLRLNQDVLFTMVNRDSSFYQEPIINKQKTPFYSAKMDLVVGSGTKGQSYLMWNDTQLFQLQVSYFTPTNSWINSPGAPDQLTPARPVLERCLECHTTYAQNLSGSKKGNSFHKTNIVYGIDCQRCHGEVAAHIQYHKLNPEELIPKHIIQYSTLTRQQRLDACALCHSGLRKETSQEAFGFNIGDVLENFSMPDYDEKSLNTLDVHGNQYGLLKASKCFQKSETLDCTTCHNPHKNERGQLALFNQKCISCHSTMKTPIACSGDVQKIQEMGNNCVQCHMPLADSKTMKIQIPNGDEIAVKVRTHLIGIYHKDSQ